MVTIETNGKVFNEMAKTIGIGPKQLQCNCCGKIVAGILPNDAENNFIYGAVENHKRIICGVHKDVAYYSGEERICLCENCANKILNKTPEIMNCWHNQQPTNGGHFISISDVKKTETILISRFQCGLSDFRRIVSILKSN